MDWKEFFKPTIGKIILFLLIPAFYVEQVVCGVAGPPCTSYGFPLPLILTLISFIFYKGDIHFENGYLLGHGQIHVAYLFIGLIASYAVASVVVYLYHELRKKARAP